MSRTLNIKRIRFDTFLLLAGPLILLGALASYRPWLRINPDRMPDSAAMVVFAAITTFILGMQKRGSRRVAIMSFLLVLVLFGPGSVGAVLLVLLAACGIGSALLPVGVQPRLPLSIIAGFSIIAGLGGWLLPFEIHYSWSWALALGAAVSLSWNRMIALLESSWEGFATAWEENPFSASFAAAMIACAALPTLLPASGYDDLAGHLQLPWQLAELHRYRLDPASQVWSLSPWATDFLQGLVQLVSGTERIGMLNLAWQLLVCALVFRLCTLLGIRPQISWLCTAAIASQPLTAFLGWSMQTELAATATCLASACLVTQANRQNDAKDARLLTVFLAFLLSMKILHAAIALPLACWAFMKWRLRPGLRECLTLLALAALICGSSYSYALVLSGNPVLPLYNEVFHSSFFAQTAFGQGPFQHPLTFSLPWDIAFRTDEHYEGLPGAAGYLLIVMVGGVVAAFFKAHTRPLAIVGLVAYLLPLLVTQNARYLYPAVALLLPATVSALHYGPIKLTAAMLVAVSALQIALMPTASWMLNDGALRIYLLQGRDGVLRQFAPERLLAEHVRRSLPAESRVLYANTGQPFAAELAGRGLVTAWYDHAIASRLPGGDGSAAAWRALLADTGSSHLIVRSTSIPEGLRTLMQQAPFIEVAKEGAASLFQVPMQPVPADTTQVAGGRVLASFRISRRSPGLALFQIGATCSDPKAPVALHWLVQGQTSSNVYDWIDCGLDGRAKAELPVSLPVGASSVAVELGPTSAASGQTLSAPVAHWTARTDIARERDYATRMLEQCYEGDSCPYLQRIEIER